MVYTEKQIKILKYLAQIDLPKEAYGYNVTNFIDFDVNKIQLDSETWFEMEREELINFLNSRKPDGKIDNTLIDEKLTLAEIQKNEIFYIHFR